MYGLKELDKLLFKLKKSKKHTFFMDHVKKAWVFSSFQEPHKPLYKKALAKCLLIKLKTA
jgi:hypothetical protein